MIQIQNHRNIIDVQFDENKFIPLRSGEIVNSSRELLNEDSLSGLANGKLSIRLVSQHDEKEDGETEEKKETEGKEEDNQEKCLGETWISLRSLVSSPAISQTLGIDRFRFEVSIRLDEKLKSTPRKVLCVHSNVNLTGNLPFSESSQFKMCSFRENGSEYVLKDGEKSERIVFFLKKVVTFISGETLQRWGRVKTQNIYPGHGCGVQ